MLNKIKRFFYFCRECTLILIFKEKIVPLRFYSARPNVGDALNVHLFEKVSGRRVLEIKSGWLSHALGVGSIMHLGTSKSLVWGSGVIEEKQLPSTSILKKMKFFAVRGKKTRELLSEKIGKTVACPLGDPAVLMPFFYTPKVTKKKRLIGLVPHYVDKETAGCKKLLLDPKIKLINVELPVEEFLDELAECEVIVSSSLHGLILADSYNIPNVWVRFSDKVIGGDFKFLDYYSTTDLIKPSPMDLRDKEVNALDAEVLASQAKVANFTEDKKLLLDAFPMRS